MRKKSYRMFRYPRTTNEKRSSQQCKYARAKRRPNNLVSAWDDKLTIETKCWKDKRKTQYRENGRGKRHKMIFDNSECKTVQDLEYYFVDHQIPHNVSPIISCTKKTSIKWYRKVPSHKEERVLNIDGKPWHTGFYFWVFRKVLLDKPIVTEYNSYETKGWRVIWWSDKDIGIDFLLRKEHVDRFHFIR